MMERASTSRVVRIGAEEYLPFHGQQHLHLVGDLKMPTLHPFFRDARLEIILCFYAAGDDGLFHWHRDVTEYEILLEGAVGYVEASTGVTHWLGPGDCSVVPAGVCVKRLVQGSTRTVAVKVPSAAEKVHCSACASECVSRQEPFAEV